MKLFGRKKKEAVEEKKAEAIEKTQLEKICSNDKETYNALRHTMFYDPRKISETPEDALEKAKAFEKQGDTERTRIWYHVAGGLAIWKGDVAKVKQYFGKCQKLAPNMGYEQITKIPEKAVAKAQEYYKTYLQTGS
ncbi:MAG: hypothetical protein NWE82_02950 [Candidatus Bathyarchaeota archaeon]|nr:hypothetical protein [Candidatus Bathyarchaeota archaeon]